MRYSRLFGKTRKLPPKDEKTKNARLLVRAGFVNKLMAGVYSYLPLGLRVIDKICRIIREEMEAIGGQQVFLPALHPAENWRKTGGWQKIDILFKLKSRSKKDYALGQSHEEVITPLAKEYLKSYKDLPLSLYQIQIKFRDELRAKSGVLRGREFLMKDLYSWHENQKDFENYYSIVKKAYLKIFERCGLTAKVTEGSGGIFSEKISYEFMVLTQAGEDDILYCGQCSYCVNLDIAKLRAGAVCPKCRKGKLKAARASEVGNVFDLGQKYSKDFKLELTDKKGRKFYPIMGCYGLGISRLLGVIVEKWVDEKGIIWPESVAPYQVHLVQLSNYKLPARRRGRQITNYSKRVYEKLREAGIEVLWDDREDVSAGEKFADADLLGIPVRLVASGKTKDKLEFKKRNQDKTELLSFGEVLQKLKKA